jgi:hypothetical protein
LRVTEYRCGWRAGECPPFTPWQIAFSNPLDAKAFRKEMVRVEPELPALKVDLYGERMMVSGRATGRTEYRVTLAADLADAFGQTLGQDQTLTFQVTAAPQSLTSAGSGFVVLDPAAGPRFSVFSVNHDALNGAGLRGGSRGLAGVPEVHAGRVEQHGGGGAARPFGALEDGPGPGATRRDDGDVCGPFPGLDERARPTGPGRGSRYAAP